MQLTSAIAAGIGVALAILALIVLRKQAPADPEGADEEDLVTASAARGGPPVLSSGS